MRLEARQVPIGDRESVSAVVAHPDRGVPDTGVAVILAHGAGSDMRAPFLTAVHEGLAARGCVSVKFNFPYSERGGRAPDRAPVLEACYSRVLAAVRDDPQIAPRRVVIGGKSLGGRMASHLAAKGAVVDGVLLLGYPLHPAGKPDQLRVAHLGRIKVPMLFFAGTRDALCHLDLLRPALQPLTAPVELHIIEGGDHSFKVPKSLHRTEADVWAEIVTESARWLTRLDTAAA